MYIDNYRILSLNAYCAAVVCPAIESANVVGYLDYNLAKGYNFFAPVFEKVDPTADLMLSDISLADAGDGLSFIQIVTTGGGLGATYSWFAAASAETAEDCWFDQDAWAPVDGVTYLAGEGFYLYCGTANGTLVLPSAL